MNLLFFMIVYVVLMGLARQKLVIQHKMGNTQDVANICLQPFTECVMLYSMFILSRHQCSSRGYGIIRGDTFLAGFKVFTQLASHFQIELKFYKPCVWCIFWKVLVHTSMGKAFEKITKLKL